MQEIAEVMELREDNRVLVRVRRQESCQGCKACSMGRDNKKYMELVIDNTLNAEVGDEIYLDLDTPDVLKAAFIAYGFPLIMMVSFTMISYYLVFPEDQMIAAIVGLVGAALSFIIIRLNENRIRDNGRFFPKMISIVRNDGIL